MAISYNGFGCSSCSGAAENLAFRHKSKHNLLKSSEVPQFAREDAITTGYRDTLSYIGCIKSIFWVHNETVNIWTHLLGFFYFLFLLHQNLFYTQTHNRTNADLVAVGIQLVTYQACMLASSLFHTFLCHSEGAKYKWQAVDHSGILLALWGTYTRIIVTNFSCFPTWMICHMVVVCGIFALVFVNKWKSSGLKKSGVELYLFLALAIYAVAPFAHWISISPYLVHHDVSYQKVLWLLFPYGLGGLGLFFYISRLPECVVSTGQVDLWGASHQIWHMLIFSGMVSWYELICWLSVTGPISCQLKVSVNNTTILAAY